MNPHNGQDWATKDGNNTCVNIPLLKLVRLTCWDKLRLVWLVRLLGVSWLYIMEHMACISSGKNKEGKSFFLLWHGLRPDL
jgi:hypothetical protein